MNKKQSSYKGNAPKEDYMFVKVIGECRGSIWNLYVKKSSEWVNIKIVATGIAERKANYWLAWNGSRFNIHKDVNLLKEHMEYIYDELIDFLYQNYKNIMTDKNLIIGES